MTSNDGCAHEHNPASNPKCTHAPFPGLSLVASFNARMNDIQAEHDRGEQADPDGPAMLAKIKADAWDGGWRAAREVIDFEGTNVWAHTVTPDGYEGNPYHPDRIAGDQS